MNSPFYQGGLVRRREQILKLINDFGLSITKEGYAYRVAGKGINILTSDPAVLLEAEITPDQSAPWNQ